MEELTQVLLPLIEAAGGKYGAVLQAVAIMGSLRVLMKPLQELARAYVNITPNTKDNAWLEGVISSKLYKGIVWLVDLGASVKLPKK